MKNLISCSPLILGGCLWLAISGCGPSTPSDSQNAEVDSTQSLTADTLTAPDTVMQPSELPLTENSTQNTLSNPQKETRPKPVLNLGLTDSSGKKPFKLELHDLEPPTKKPKNTPSEQVDFGAINPNLKAANLVGCWTDSREENAPGSTTQAFRPCDFKKFPASRFRFRMDLKSDQTCQWLYLAPNDAHHMEPGTWTYDPGTHLLKIKNNAGKEVQKYEVKGGNAEVLLLVGRQGGKMYSTKKRKKLPIVKTITNKEDVSEEKISAIEKASVDLVRLEVGKYQRKRSFKSIPAFIFHNFEGINSEFFPTGSLLYGK
ncbi:MAG: hypothetical protein H6581_18790 [Bacteroidia bacterium]|nr:hypothetical protein [Bacteroidia bacterium]